MSPVKLREMKQPVLESQASRSRAMDTGLSVPVHPTATAFSSTHSSYLNAFSSFLGPHKLGTPVCDLWIGGKVIWGGVRELTPNSIVISLQN